MDLLGENTRRGVLTLRFGGNTELQKPKERDDGVLSQVTIGV